MKKLIALVLTGIMVFMCVGCAPAQQPVTGDTPTAKDAPDTQTPSAPSDQEMLSIDVLGHTQTGSLNPTEDILTPIWREKTGVIPEIVSIPLTQDLTQWMQMQIVADTMPSVIAPKNMIFESPERYKMLLDAGQLKALDIEMLAENMPLTTKRLEKMGVTIKEWLEANLEPASGNLYYIPSLPSNALDPDYAQTMDGKSQGPVPYCMWFRDDILKKIFPQAKTEAELKALAIEKNGELSIEDIMDAPLTSFDELYEYFKKVDELGMSVDGKPIIAAHPQKSAIDSFQWSLFTGCELWWQGETFNFPNNPETGNFTEFSLTPNWKNMMSWANRCFNDGLFGEEMFIQKEDQLNSRVINNEYACINYWLPLDQARAKAVDAGETYGWRVYPIFLIDLVTDACAQDSSVLKLENNFGAVGFNANVSDDIMPKLIQWIDWNYSEQAAELRAWGTPDMYTGDGMDRRFKDEYKDVENYMVSMLKSTDGKDGWYYGMLNAVNDDFSAWNHETLGIGCASKYIYAPSQVYPFSQDTYTTLSVTNRAIQKYYRENGFKFLKQGAMGDEVSQAKVVFDQKLNEYNEMYKVIADERMLQLIDAVSGQPQDFEANYDKYIASASTPELMAKLEELKTAYFDFFNKRKAYQTPIN